MIQKDDLNIRKNRQRLVKKLIRQKKKLHETERIAKELESLTRQSPDLVNFLTMNMAFESGDINRAYEMRDTLFNCSSILDINWDLLNSHIKKAKRQVRHYEPRNSD